jgi:uroporphyrinogen-III synthase
MGHKVFISRELRGSSPVQELKNQVEIIAESLLTFKPVPFNLSPTDWLFFYSQQGVIHFFRQYEGDPVWKKLAAFGPKTGSILREMGHFVVFTGDGIAESTARAFSMVGRGDHVTFVRANHSRQSLQQLLSTDCRISDLVVYDNQPRQNLDIPPCDVLIFTSPLNAKSYFDQYPYQENQKIIAIGSTTREFIRRLGIREVDMPEQPTEEALAALLKKYFGI